MKISHAVKQLAQNLPPVKRSIINNEPVISSLALAAKVRDHMLRSEKVLTLNDILQVSSLFYGERDLLSLYDMDPYTFYEKGIRLLGRTSIECTIDAQSIQVAQYIKNFKDDFFQDEQVVFLDLFAGSGNSLYHVDKKLKPLFSIGIESNKTVYNLSYDNLKIVKSNSKLYLGDAFDVIKKLKLPQKTPIFVFVDPPWGKGLSPKYGLDLMKTTPPVYKIIKDVEIILSQNPLIFIIKTYEKMVDSSVKAITNQFSYSSTNLISVMDNKFNIGMMICTNEKEKFSQGQSFGQFKSLLAA